MDRIVYTVREIAGDYAVLVTADGVENRMAMALLPPETEEGGKIIFEDFSYSYEANTN